MPSLAGLSVWAGDGGNRMSVEGREVRFGWEMDRRPIRARRNPFGIFGKINEQ